MIADSATKSNNCGRNCITGARISAIIKRIAACNVAGAPVSDSAVATKQIVRAVQTNLISFRPKGPNLSYIEAIATSLNHSCRSHRKPGAEYE